MQVFRMMNQLMQIKFNQAIIILLLILLQVKFVSVDETELKKKERKRPRTLNKEGVAK